jgi:hypothetical protein
LFVTNNTVYTAFGYNGYWIGNDFIPLNGYATSIFVYNGVIYSTGMDKNGNLCYWEGTNETIIDPAVSLPASGGCE